MKSEDKITEQASNHHGLEFMKTREILAKINEEDQSVPQKVAESIPEINELIEAIIPGFQRGGRLFYLGAGTSGRLGILDASEIPPTYGMPHDRVIGLIAGGDTAIRKSVEFAEDSKKQACLDLSAFELTPNDTVVGIAASGTTPYAIGALEYAKEAGCTTGCITNNPNTPLAKAANHAIEVVVGPEFVTGSTRMKSGTAQKLVLNMISTALMIRIGRVKGNKMINMQLSNNKLINRGVRFLMDDLKIGHDQAADLIKEFGSVNAALEANK